MLVINGKFSAQRTTGVQRVARELTLALDALAPRGVRLLHPMRAAPPPVRHVQASPLGPACLPLHAWEQLALPWAARDAWLLNLAGAAPALAVRQLCLLHDAAVFDHPEAYQPRYVAWYRRLFKRLARSGARIATVSEFSRQRLALHLELAPGAIAVVPNGADHLDATVPDATALARHGLRPGGYLLAVGSSNPTKNLPALVRAHAAALRGAGPPLVIVGGTHARVFADEARVEPPGVLRTGPLDDAPLKALYEGALALVFPSLYEGFGLPPLEAMACGCPVAAARAAAIPEVCGDAALYFDPGDEAAMAGAISRIVADAALRDDLRFRGRQRVARFRWRTSGAHLLHLAEEAQAG